MIDLKFGLFWSGAPLSYLRYLTFVSLRHFHPNAKIELFTTDNYQNSGYIWRDECQDFENDNFGKDYLEDLKDLDVEIKTLDKFSQYPSNFQSDFFRWWWIKKNGGFYLDTDHIILKSFENIDRDCDFIYSAYNAKSCGLYTPVGVIGGSKKSEIVQWINDILPKYYDCNSYNSLGPFMLRSVITTKNWRDKLYNTPSYMFYPVPDSYLVTNLYSDMVSEDIVDNIKKAFSIHWYGGHPLSQDFNKSYTEGKAKVSLDVISCILRNKEII